MLVAAAIASAVGSAAVGLFQLTNNNIARTDALIQEDQAGRTAFQKIMGSLHSGCVVPEEDPVQEGSNATKIKFVSEKGEEAELPNVREHEIIYEASAERLVENVYKSSGTYGAWTFPAANKEGSTRTIVTHVTQNEETKEGTKIKIPIFRYYEYYQENPETHVNPDPGVIESSPLAGGESAAGLSKSEAAKVARVTVAFRVGPEHFRALHLPGNLKPSEFEDSAVYRLTPASSAAETPNEPCA